MQTLFSYEISDSEERAIFQPFVFQCSREQWRTILLTKFFTSFDGDLSADRFSIINPRASEIEIELLHFFTVTIFVNFASVWNHMFRLFYSLVFFFLMIFLIIRFKRNAACWIPFTSKISVFIAKENYPKSFQFIEKKNYNFNHFACVFQKRFATSMYIFRFGFKCYQYSRIS